MKNLTATDKKNEHVKLIDLSIDVNLVNKYKDEISIIVAKRPAARNRNPSFKRSDILFTDFLKL
jgi:hypothetical protein